MLPETKKTNKKRKALYLLIAFFAFFIAFIYFIATPSLKSTAIRSLATCNNVKEVQELYQKYKLELFDDDDFLFEVRTQLTSFDLPDSVVLGCQSWLPQPPTSLNLIIIPDLSLRIKDENNNEHQIENDKAIIKYIWESFEKKISPKTNSKDYLKITITDPGQAQGQFDQLADNLICDLSLHENKVNRIFFTDYRKRKFLKQTDELYSMSLDKPSGADYVTFFKRYLKQALKTSTLFDSYQNKLIILTDGYLEKSGHTYTRLNVVPSKKAENMTEDEIIKYITQKKLNIPIGSVSLNNTEVLVCEVNERKKGVNYHFPILHAYWKDWFSNMDVKKFRFVRRDYSMKQTYKVIDDFLQ